ncbi:DegV family protein [Thermosediminibacter litoriperuensis]|uniref:DegV family protein with EDD domain n=1 Tax=Thermosediminibacter litoriperuensis TaxID=291989 RepID=A0A5S5B0S2_9FIRM|nr:DegV family protein [Thermosediminibacter litoriperuensis]TYP59972.1 DegV family protein with EDD domain [Thermosediminibacter litoriperuensis]
MESVKIVTDSTADLPADVVEKYGISIVPLKIFFGEEEYRDGIDITPDEFYKKLRTSPHHPRTSQPPPTEFVECFKKLANNATRVISIHLSGKLSGTYNSAVVAGSMVDIPVDVVDSQGASMMLGFMAIEAAKAAREGKQAGEILDTVEDLKKRIRIYFLVDTLEYLRKGGRIGRAAALLGNLLNVKPVLTIEDGLITPVERIRGKAKALNKLLEKISQDAARGPLTGAVVHSDCLEEASRFKKVIEERFEFRELYLTTLGCVLGAHSGPGLIGVVYYY